MIVLKRCSAVHATTWTYSSLISRQHRFFFSGYGYDAGYGFCQPSFLVIGFRSWLRRMVPLRL